MTERHILQVMTHSSYLLILPFPELSAHQVPHSEQATSIFHPGPGW